MLSSEPFRTSHFVTAILICVIYTSIAVAQAKRDPDRGFVAGASYALSDIETINTTNGNLMLNIPLASLPAGRGPGFTFALRYNSKLWDSKGTRQTDGVHPETGEPYYFNLEEPTPSDKGGWTYSSFYSLEVIHRYDLEPIPESCETSGPDYAKPAYAWKVRLRTPDGSVHEFRPAGQLDIYFDGYFNVDPNGRTYSHNSSLCATSTQTTTSGMTYYSSDGSFLRLVIDHVSGNNGSSSVSNPWTLYFPDGGKVVRPLNGSQSYFERVYDRNGNYISLGSSGTSNVIAEDQFGRTVRFEHDPNDSTKDYIKRDGVGGEEVIMTVKWKTTYVYRLYDAAPGEPYARPDRHSQLKTTSFGVVDYIELPTRAGSLRYTFGYNGAASQPAGTNYTTGWGELSDIALPSGADVHYDYFFDGSTSTPTIGVQFNTPTEKELTYDLEYDGSSSTTTETWQYNISTSGSTITGPDGSQAQQAYGDTNYPGSAFPGYVYRDVKPDGTMVERIWQANAPELNASYDGACNPYVKTEFTSIMNASSSYTLTSAKDFEYDKNGNLLSVKEYDWMPYSSVPRTDGRPTGLPSNASSYLKRITANEYYNPVPTASSISYDDPNGYHLSTSPRLLNLVKSTEVQDASSTPKTRSEMTYDHTTYSSNTLAGNLTQTKTWDSFKGGSAQSYSNPLTSTNSITTSATYNSFGMLLTTTDGNLNVTVITYGNVACPGGNVTDLYPTQTVVAYGTSVARTSSAIYDCSTGLVTSATDEDNGVTAVTVYDDLGRPTIVKNAYGTALESWTQTSYDDDARRIIVKSDLETVGDAKRVAIQHFDQLGRVRLTRTLEDASTEDPEDEADGIKVQTRYKFASGYTYQLTSNPYRAATSAGASGEETMGWTLATGWASGIRSEIQTFAGAGLPSAFGGSNSSSTGIVRTDIDANRTLVTDQAGKQRISKTNALGHLTDVWEVTAQDASTGSLTFPNTSIAYGYQTSYSYDPLNNLTTVSQGAQTRTFAYSSVSRLTSATNPESGTIGYVYDPNGNLTRKTDARSIVTTYSYDPLNRVTDRAYTNEPSGSETPDVEYTYGTTAPAIGKLIKVESSVSTTEYTAFDILGRVTASRQTTDGTVYTSGYAFNLSGALVEQTYPSGRVVKNVLDSNGDLSLVQSKKNSNSGYWNYASSFTYNAAGAVTSMQLGNGRWESTIFNSRLQPTQIALGATQTAHDLLRLQYSYGDWNGSSIDATKNSGNIVKQIITVPNSPSNSDAFTATQKYYYDSLNRIDDATEEISSQTWRQDLSYDRYGNRNFVEANTTTIPRNCGTSPNFTICAADQKKYNPSINSSNNNRIDSSQGYSFDPAGNTTGDSSGNTFVFDGENKQVEAKNSGNYTIGRYYYDGDGKRVKKIAYNSTGTEIETTVFVYDAAGKQIAEYSDVVASTNDAKVAYLTNDHLGSPRINTDANGAVTARHDYHPFGEEVTTSERTAHPEYGDDSIRKQFTGYERDNESELDFAENRYYNPGHGRFTTTDPLLESGRLENPQTWNRYVYVLNDPINYVDPDGLYECKGSADECKAFRNDLASAQARLADIEKKYGKNSDEYAKASKSLGSYGCESKGGNCVGADGKAIKDAKGNFVKDTAGNVHVSFDWKQSSPAHTSTDVTSGIVKVQFKGGNHSDFGLMANEGINSADMQSALKTGTSVSLYQSEKDGLFVQAVFAELKYEAAGSTSAYFGSTPQERFTFWKKSLETPDHKAVRAGRESAIVTRLKENYGLSPGDKRPLVTFPRGYKPRR
jgi:RHS repeat-associated protein